MNKAIKAIALADDVSIVRAADYFVAMARNAMNQAGIELQELIDLASIDPALTAITQAAEHRPDTKFNAADSTDATRRVLVTAAEDPTLTAIVEHCVSHWPDDRQAAGKTVTVGLLATLLVIVSTTQIDYVGEKIQMHKKTAIPDSAKASFSLLKSKFEFEVQSSSAAHAAEPKDASVEFNKN